MYKSIATLKERYAPGSYFFKLFSLIGVMMMIIIVILAYVLFGTFSQYYEKSLQANNKSILAQISYNIQYTSDYINQLLLTLYSRQETAQLLNSDKFDVLIANQSITNLDQTLVTAPFIDSVYLYNGALRQFYVMGTDRYVREQSAMGDREVVDWLDHPADIQPLKPIFRRIADPSSRMEKTVFTYVMYDSVDKTGTIPRMIVINVKADWIMNLIDTMSRSQFGPSSTVFIVDQAHHIMKASRGEGSVSPMLLRSSCINAAAVQDAGNDGQYSCKADSIEYYASYQSIPNLNWKLLVMTTNQSMAGKIVELKTYTVVVSALLILIGLVLALFAAKYLHFPISRLQTNVSAFLDDARPGGKQSRNEFQYVNQSLKQMKENLSSLQQFISHHLLTLKRDMISKLLVQPVADAQQLEPLFTQLNVKLPVRGSYMLILIKIDRISDARNQLGTERWECLKEEVTNTIEHHLAERYACEVLQSGDDWIAVIDTGTGQDRQSVTQSEHLSNELLFVQAQLEHRFHLSVSIFISTEGTGIESVSRLYKEVGGLSQYRLQFGRGCILTYEDVHSIKEERMIFPTALAEKLMEKLTAGEKDGINRSLTGILAYFSEYSQPNIQFGLYYLLHQAVATIRMIDSNSRAGFDIDMIQMNHKLSECETMDDAAHLFNQLFTSVMEKMNERKENKLTHSVVQMKAYIDEHLTDFTLSPEHIASILHLSTDYVRKLFKKEMSLSIAAYMNQERVKLLAGQLLATEDTIDTLLEAVGWDNKNYFYKLFKAQFGMTPAEFRAANRANPGITANPMAGQKPI